jgi:hypothetical protein
MAYLFISWVDTPCIDVIDLSAVARALNCRANSNLEATLSVEAYSDAKIIAYMIQPPQLKRWRTEVTLCTEDEISIEMTWDGDEGINKKNGVESGKIILTFESQSAVCNAAPIKVEYIERESNRSYFPTYSFLPYNYID